MNVHLHKEVTTVGSLHGFKQYLSFSFQYNPLALIFIFYNNLYSLEIKKESLASLYDLVFSRGIQVIQCFTILLKVL